MKILITLIFCIANVEIAFSQGIHDMRLFSPKSNVSLELKGGEFKLSKLTFDGHQTLTDTYQTGSYSTHNDTLILVSDSGKLSKLLKVTTEIYNPLSIDSVAFGEMFLAWTIYYENGKVMQTGGWTRNNQKHGVWRFYNTTGALVNKKLFKKGKLKDDNYKFDWEN